MDGAPSASFPEKAARFFEFQRLRTNWRTEILAGVTTFVTMAYILVVNPGILSNAIFLETSGDLFDGLVIATAMSAAIATIIMALYAKLPFGLAPGMGLNAFFAFGVVLGLGVDWRAALGAVFIEGLIFIVLSVTNVRSRIIAAIPDCIKHATTGGIGLFIAYIALQNSGLIVTNEATLTGLGDFQAGPSAIALLGILVTAGLVARRIPGALLWGILATALFAWVFGVAAWPEGFWALPTFPSALFGQSFQGLNMLWRLNLWDAANIIFVLLFVDLFDTVGTLAGLGSRAGYIDEDGRFPNSEKALMADAVGTTAGAVLGTSTVTTYIESAAGIEEGGRSGATALVVALLFVVSILFTPLLAGIPSFASAPALIVVGSLMLAGVRFINWEDPAEAISSFLTVLIMPLSFSIAEGLAVGLVTYPFIKLCQGQGRQVSGILWALAIIFAARYIFAP
ncbi:MAG: NCS2 family permease [Cyanobacteria bacterium J06649_4]